MKKLENGYQQIQASVFSVLPKIADGNFANQELYSVKRAVLDYLPATIENYRKLPPCVSVHPLQEGEKLDSF